MLDQLRKNASGLVAQILIGLLVLSFAVWGINDVFTGSVDTTVATVGDEEIAGELFLFEYRRDLNQRSQSFGRQLSTTEGQALGFDRRVLEQMIGRTALDVAARNLGLAAGTDLVLEDIMSDAAFQGPTGQFDRETFQQTLYTNGISEAFLVDDRKRYITRQQLVEAVSQNVDVPDGFAQRMYAVLNEQRKAKYVVLTPEMVDAPGEPDDETLQNFYEVRAQGLFREPETRSFSYLLMTPQVVAETIDISEELLREEYALRKAGFDQPERRSIEQISYPTIEEAQAAHATLNEGKTFSALAEDQGLQTTDYQLGVLTKAQIFDTNIAEAAFGLEEGTVSEPVEGPLGWVLIRAAGIIPAVESTFEGVQQQLRDALAADRAYDEIYELSNQVEDARAGGLPLGEAVAELGLTTTAIPAVTSAGLTQTGQRAAGLPTDDAILNTAFEYAQGDEIPMGELPDGAFYWVEVNTVTPARTRPLDEVRNEVIATWKEEEREATLLRLAADLAARVNGGETLQAVTSEFGRAPIETPELRRGMTNETFSRIAVNNLFSIQEGEATYGPVGFGNSVVLLQASEIVSGNSTDDDEAFTSFKDRIDQAISDDLMVQYVNAVRSDLGVDINQQAIAYVIGGEGQYEGRGGI